MTDLFYYSNHCKHSQKVIQYISKNNLIDKISCICIDKRMRDAQNNHIIILLENGQKVSMPPSIQTVPTMLRPSYNHTIVLGAEKIIEYIQSEKKYINHQTQSNILQNNVEPISYEFNISPNNNISSEKFTDFNMSSAALGAKGTGKERQMYNYVPVDSNISINAPVETYQADKISSDVTVDKLLQSRNTEISELNKLQSVI